jgi:hypothetical protein
MSLPVLENAFSQRVNAVIQKTREARRGPYYQHLYVVKEDGEPALRLWALSCLVQDRADQLPSYQQFIQQLKDKARMRRSARAGGADVWAVAGQRCWILGCMYVGVWMCVKCPIKLVLCPARCIYHSDSGQSQHHSRTQW